MRPRPHRRTAAVLVGLLAVPLTLGLALLTAVGTGVHPFVVRTGSMAPTINPGDLVLADEAVRPRVGDVATFAVGSQLVTHRVVGRTAEGYRTKGDANSTNDPWQVRRAGVRGTVVRALPRVGFLVVYLRQPSGIASVVTLLVSAILAWQLFFGASPDRRRERQHSVLTAAGVAALGVLLLVPVGAAVGGAATAVRSTGAWFTDSAAGSLTFDVGCADTHEHGNGPGTGHGHGTCHGNGHGNGTGHSQDDLADGSQLVVEVPAEAPDAGPPVSP